MNQRVAVGAATIEILDRTERLRLGGVAAGHVARVANPGHPYLEQLRVAAAMWLVAVCAVFHDRRMLPQKRPAAFRVAAVAILIDRALNKLAWVRAAVRIMATGAGNLALSVRHVRGALQLGPPHLVTAEAEFRLRLLGAYVLGERRSIAGFRAQSRIALGRAAIVDRVTVDAGHGARLVRTASPEDLVSLGMA